MIMCQVFNPESPLFQTRHGNKEKANTTIRQLYSGIKAYNF